MLSYFVSTQVYSQPAFQYSAEGYYPAVNIPVKITAMKVASGVAKTTTMTGVPYTHPTQNNSVGGTLISWAPSELPKLLVEGYWETPTVSIDGMELPALQRAPVGTRLTYGDFVAMNMEGRGHTLDLNKGAIDPAWFRDPYGRLYVTPRIIDLSAQHIEGRPMRQNFQISMQLTTGFDL